MTQGQCLRTIYFSWQHVLLQHIEFLDKEKYTNNVNDNFMFFIGELGLVGGTFDVIGKNPVKRLINFLHKEVKIRNLNITMLCL